MITTKQLLSTYGTPGENAKFLMTIDLPYPMRLAWDKKTTITKMTCHRLVADNFLRVFKELLKEYGLEKIQELGIDLFGGCYNFRKMRGGTELSRHAWAVAIDLDPERNLLKETAKTARFARPEYKPMMDIFYKNGFVNLGLEKGYDFMHFEIKE